MDASENPDLRERTDEQAPADDEDSLRREEAGPPPRGLLRRFVRDVLVQPGDEIGPYRLLRVLGEGGCGIVYLAEQSQPIRRQVALKVIKPGMDSRQVLVRFEAEQQALARMEHPHVARVHDAGLTPGGRPYFVMEYVQGVPLTDYCDEHKLTVEERLRLFLHVCAAVQHAHQKGIIHRDLKPSNLLVTIEDEQAVPKVIDFGVARAISQPLTEQTLHTEQGQLVGTPEYMSPEQADAGNQDIDTRTDVYSLGVVLYELLTGVLPFDRKTFREDGIERMRQVIREEEPATPSTRLSRISPAESVPLAERRGTDVPTLCRKLHGDLDWITLKAMAKDRTRRYESVGELAADIRRHLDQEPVTAVRPSTSYRLRKFVRRHRALVTGLAAVLLTLMAGSTGMMLLALEARQQARAAQAAASFLSQDLLGSVAPEQTKSPAMTVHSLLDIATDRLQGKFAEQPLVEAAIRQSLGETYAKLGDYSAAEPHLRRAYDLRREHLGVRSLLTLTSMGQLGRLHFLQARYPEAEPLLRESWRRKTARLGREDPQTLEAAAWLGLLYLYRSAPGQTDRAEELLAETFRTAERVLGQDHPVTLEARYGVAFLEGLLWGRFEEAESLCLEGLQRAEQKFGREHRLTLELMTLSAWLYAWQGDYEKAESQATAALETSRRVLGEEHPETILALGARGWVYAMQCQYEYADPQLSESVELSGRILGPEHACTLSLKTYLAWMYIAQGRYEEAQSLLVRVIESRAVLKAEHPTILDALSGMAGLYVMQGRVDRLQAWCSEELETRSKEAGEDKPASAFVLNTLAWWQAVYPGDTVRNGSEAKENATRACALTGWRSDRCLATLAAACAETGDYEAAVRWQDEALALWTRDRGKSGVSEPWLRYSAQLFRARRPIREGVLAVHARYLIANGQYDKAERELTRTLAASRRYLGEEHSETRGCTLALVELYEAWDKPGEAEKWRLGPAAPK